MRSKPGISRCCAALLLVEQRLQGGVPAGAQRRDAQRPLELAARVTGQVKQRIDLRDAHALGTGRDLHDLVAGFDLALFQNAEIETGPAVRDEQRGHLRLVHADAHPVAGDARLCHFEQSATHPVAIANAHLLVGQAVDCEILPELPIGEVVSTELALPMAIGVHLIDEDGAVLAPVSRQIPLPVAVDIEPPCHAAALNRCLPDGRANSLFSPRDVAREADVY